MNVETQQPPAGLARRLSVLLLLLACTGCAWMPAAPPATEQAYPSPDSAPCALWYAQLDAETDQAGVRDAGATPITGFPQLRVDRFTAALRSRVVADAAAPASPVLAALVQRLRDLDQAARTLEIANLPAAARDRLAAGLALGPEPAALSGHARHCAQRLTTSDLATPKRIALLLQRLRVPDDYATVYRILGLYALSRAPFLYGVRRLEAEQRAAFAQDRPPPPGTIRRRLSPPSRPDTSTMSTERLRQMLAPPADDPLQIPAPTPVALEALFAHFAPSFELDTASNDDRPGALAWHQAAIAGAGAMLQVDTHAPVVYRQLAYTSYGAQALVQLVYTVWFPARTRNPNVPLDLLAGKLDGLVWRVTLAPDGTPLVYDSMHPCGCYHMFFPTPAARPKPAPDDSMEWASSPQSLPMPAAGDRIVLRVAAGTHYLERVYLEPQDSGHRYAWRDYDALRSLPLGQHDRRSMFGPDGFVEGTDRPESWLFWPMGIQRAGAMRQWGRHATAFVGRRHFDDADLLEKRFEFDALTLAP